MTFLFRRVIRDTQTYVRTHEDTHDTWDTQGYYLGPRVICVTDFPVDTTTLAETDVTGYAIGDRYTPGTKTLSSDQVSLSRTIHILCVI